MHYRQIQQRVEARSLKEGAGVRVHRTLGTPALRHLDPFLLLDHISSDQADEYLGGFPEHPHRGFSTFTYMLDGHMQHADSMGNKGDLEPGGAQWMKAASGILHSEMPQQDHGLLRGFQLWINLPAREKMSAPEYQEIQARAIPEQHGEKYRIRLLAGNHEGQQGPIHDPHTEVQILDIQLAAEAHLTLPVNPAHHAFVYVFEGAVQVAEQTLENHTLAVLDQGDGIRLSTAGAQGRLLLVTGKPIGEPIVQYGPFVMNQRDEIDRAMQDYQQGTLVQHKAHMDLRSE